MPDSDSRIDRATLVVGGIILVVGVLFLFRPYLGWVGQIWTIYWRVVRQVAVGLALVVAGLAVILGSRRRASLRLPEKGVKLTKSRDRIVSGVVGGMADYFGMDHTVMRLGVVALVLLLNIFWQVVIAYIVLSVIIPEPEGMDR